MNLTLSNQERLNLISSLQTLLSAGIPILEAVTSTLKDAKGNEVKILEKLKVDLTEGKTIADSFARFPKAFDPITLSLIRASEEAGTLETTLKDLSYSIQKDIEFNEKIKAALTYPFLVSVVFSGVLLLILGFVMPRIATVFSRLKVTLPLSTKIMIKTSAILLNYTPFVIAGILLVICLIIILYRTKKKLFLDVLYSLPLLSTLAKDIDFTRLTHSLALLLTSGIPLPEALGLSQSVVAKQKIALLIARCKETVTSGGKLSEGLAKSKGLVPDTMIKITEAGEKSGTLEKSMQDLAAYFDFRVDKMLKTLAVLIEPVLLLLIGLLVGGMMISIIAPIYQLIGQIRGR